MIKKYKPNSLQELKELVSDKSVHLGDIDTSLITDMTELFKDSTRKNFEGHLERDHDEGHVLRGEILQPSHRRLGCFKGGEYVVHVLRSPCLQPAA